MDLNASLIISYYDKQATANIMIGKHTIAYAESKSDLKKAISKTISQFRDVKSINKVIISKDFTTELKIGNTINDILYIRILPKGDSWQKKEAYFSDDDDISSKVKALDLVYNQEGEYTNYFDIKNYIDKYKPKLIALNYVHSTKFSNIEFMAYNKLKKEYPKILIYPSINLFNRNFIVRGNTQLLNLMLTPMISDYIESLNDYLNGCGINAPLYFHRTSKGLVGADTILTQGIDTYACEQYLRLCDIAKLTSEEDALVADFERGYLFFIKNNSPITTMTRIDLAHSKILEYELEKHDLTCIRNESQFKIFLDKLTPHRGPMLLYILGSPPFNISEFFIYPLRNISKAEFIIKGSLNTMKYRIEAEIFIGQSNNIDIGRAQLTSILLNAAIADGISADESNLSSMLVPMKYFKKKVFMLRLALEANVGVQQ